MITKLDQYQREIATQIHRVFQVSYKIEAEILNAIDFPPLKRTVADFLESTTIFHGFIKDEVLTAVIEIKTLKDSIHIQSLVVDPDYFRLGIASRLIEFVLQSNQSNSFTVETGVKNKPAINLYERFGFKETKQYDTDHGIRKIKLLLEQTKKG